MRWCSRVCRSRLADPHEALDAFQATFLVLIRKLRGLWVRDSLGPWLHQVALRTAACARAASVRRRRAEQRAAERADVHEAVPPPADEGWEQTLHAEIDRLPERYRAVIVLCDLQGLTCEEVARRIGRPVGTVKCWRARGRERLRRRLVRAGLAPPGLSGVTLAGEVTGNVGHALEIAQATRALEDGLVAGSFPAPVRALVKGVFQVMILSKLKTAAALVCAVLVLATGLGTAAWVAAGDPKRPGTAAHDGPVRSAAAPPAPFHEPEKFGANAWPLSLREAIRIGLENSHTIHVSGTGGQAPDSPEPTREQDSPARPRAADCTVQPADGKASTQRFRSEVMALVRSIEQQYWMLCQQLVALWAAEQAVRLTEDVLKPEQQKLTAQRGTVAEVAEASQRLEQFRLDLVMKVSDVLTVERRLRDVMKLPTADTRRIVPVSVPAEEKLEPDWDRSLALMLQKQPDVVQTRTEAENSTTGAISEAVLHSFLPDAVDPASKTRNTSPAPRQLNVLDSQALTQVTHQATHSLARFFLELDANYKQYQVAKRLRNAAAQGVEAQRGAYDHGRITLDRHLDAVAQYAQAVAQEAQFKSTYNISIVALEEARGTLLDYERITVVEPHGDTTWQPATPIPAVPAASPPPTTACGAQVSVADRSEPGNTASSKSPVPGVPPGRTISFQLSIHAGPNPVDIHGSVTIAPALAQEERNQR